MNALKRSAAIILALCVLVPSVAASAAYVRGFEDVSDSAWYAEAVGYVYDQGMFMGESSTSFLPNYPVSRGMFLTVIGRYAGAKASSTGKGVIKASGVNIRSGPSTSYTKLGTVSTGDVVTVFGIENGWYRIGAGTIRGYVRQDLMSATDTVYSDVQYAQYYSAYIQWAYRLGLADGVSATAFGPDSAVTRQEMCTILYKYCNSLGVTLPSTYAKMSFTDAESISPEAASAVYAMQQAGVFNGRGDGSFSPHAGATRAEVAAVLMRFCRLMATLDIPQQPDNGESSPLDDYVIFGKVPSQSAAVDDSYYGDACFIGHSIVNGWSQSYFKTFPSADFYAKDGISAAGTLTYDGYSYTDATGAEQTGTLSQALDGKSYGKVYIMLGINDAGGKLQSYYNNMASIIALVRQAQPNAKIYLISLTPLSEKYTTYRDAFAVSSLLEYNNVLQQLSVEKDVYYIDVFEYFADENGYLLEQYSADGLHLNRLGASALRTYLDQHTA